jgi:hypothetical protein
MPAGPRRDMAARTAATHRRVHHLHRSIAAASTAAGPPAFTSIRTAGPGSVTVDETSGVATFEPSGEGGVIYPSNPAVACL